MEEKRRIFLSKRTVKADERIKLLVAIVDDKDGVEITEICNRENASLSYAFDGFGTARTAILDYLGLGGKGKKVVLSLIPESCERSILDGIQKEMSLYLVGKGICFTLPLSGISGIIANGLIKGLAGKGNKESGRKRKMSEKRTHELIIVAVQSGYAEEVMDVARNAGAGGGTLIHAMTLNNQKAEQLIGITLQKETEILAILATKEGKMPIMNAIKDALGLKTDAGGILFSLPVDHLVGVGGGGE